MCRSSRPPPPPHLSRLEELRRVRVARHVLLEWVGDAAAEQLGHCSEDLPVVDAARGLPRDEHARPQAQRAEGRERRVAPPAAARLCEQLQRADHRHRDDVVLGARVAGEEREERLHAARLVQRVVRVGAARDGRGEEAQLVRRLGRARVCRERSDERLGPAEREELLALRQLKDGVRYVQREDEPLDEGRAGLRGEKLEDLGCREGHKLALVGSGGVQRKVLRRIRGDFVDEHGPRHGENVRLVSGHRAERS